MKHWKVPREGRFIFVICINFTIGSVPITAVRWPSYGKFVLGLTDILFVANHANRCINTIVCACQFWLSGKVLVLLIICETHGTIDKLCFPQLPQKAQWPQGPNNPLTCSLVFLEARCLQSRRHGGLDPQIMLQARILNYEAL